MMTTITPSQRYVTILVKSTPRAATYTVFRCLHTAARSASLKQGSVPHSTTSGSAPPPPSRFARLAPWTASLCFLAAGHSTLCLSAHRPAAGCECCNVSGVRASRLRDVPGPHKLCFLPGPRWARWPGGTVALAAGCMYLHLDLNRHERQSRRAPGSLAGLQRICRVTFCLQ